MRVVLLTNDNREIQRKYNLNAPIFGPAPEALIEGFKLFPDQVEIHIVSCLQQMPANSPDKLADNIYYHPLHVPKIGWLRTGYSGCIHAVRRKLRELRPDIVHGQGTERDCAITAVHSGFPNILTIHGNMRALARFIKARPFSYYWLAAKLESYCLKRTRGVVAISSYTQKNVAALTQKSWLLPNAVYPSFFNLPRNPIHPPRLLCVANIAPWKNQTNLIRALEAAHPSPEFELRFLGNGNDADPYFQEFRSMVTARPWCSHPGFADRDMLQKELSEAALLILPSLEDNCPMVILEAASAGLPTAASRIGGIPDLIVEGKTGVMFDPKNLENMSRVIQNLLFDPATITAMGEQARVVGHEQFSPLKIAGKHLDIYKEIIASV